jgi:predicted nucleic acid-binding protein
LQRAAYFDVTAFMELLKGGKNVLAKVEDYREFYTGASVAAQLICSEEFLIGKKLLKKRQVRGMLEAVEILPLTREDAEKAGEILGKLKASGKHAGLDEGIVVAQCLRRGLTLVTNKKPFRDFKELNLSVDEI